MNPHDQLWHNILKDLEKLYSEEVYNELFAPITATHKYQNGLIFMIVSNHFYKNRIDKMYINKINELALKYSEIPVRFKFFTKEDLISEYKNEIDTTIIKKELKFDYPQRDLNNTYTFDNFVVGKSNNFAFRMAMKTADQPGVVANPLYIFGDVGLGKTHLMQAIGNAILDQDVSKKVLYIPAASFIQDFVSLVKHKDSNSFNAKYGNIDVLLVDDIQIMAKATETQAEFFKLFNYLHGTNKQIVITSDRPASELKDIMTRLTSRFEMGLTVDIQVPDLEHRINILKRKLSSFDSSSNVNDEVLAFIASQFITNVREMEGALNRLFYYALTNNLDVTLNLAEEALEPLLKTKQRSNQLNENNYDKILSIVADYYQVSVDDLISKKRHAKITAPRHISMYIIKYLYHLPYKTIGQLFGNRDHSTVLTACEKIDNELKSDKSLKVAVDTIFKKINMTSTH